MQGAVKHTAKISNNERIPYPLLKQIRGLHERIPQLSFYPATAFLHRQPHTDEKLSEDSVVGDYFAEMYFGRMNEKPVAKAILIASLV